MGISSKVSELSDYEVNKVIQNQILSTRTISDMSSDIDIDSDQKLVELQNKFLSGDSSVEGWSESDAEYLIKGISDIHAQLSEGSDELTTSMGQISKSLSDSLSNSNFSTDVMVESIESLADAWSSRGRDDVADSLRESSREGDRDVMLEALQQTQDQYSKTFTASTDDLSKMMGNLLITSEEVEEQLKSGIATRFLDSPDLIAMATSIKEDSITQLFGSLGLAGPIGAMVSSMANNMASKVFSKDNPLVSMFTKKDKKDKKGKDKRKEERSNNLRNSLLKSNVSTSGKGFKTVVKAIKSVMGRGISRIVPMLMMAMPALIGGLTALIPTLMSGLSLLIPAMILGLTAYVSTKIGGFLNEAINSAVEYLTDGVNTTLGGFIFDLTQKISKWLSSLPKLITDSIEKMINSVLNIGDAASELVGEAVDTVYNNTIGAVTNFFSSEEQKPIKQISQIATDINSSDQPPVKGAVNYVMAPPVTGQSGSRGGGSSSRAPAPRPFEHEDLMMSAYAGVPQR